MSDRFGLPCKITNDANAAAMGEMTYGSAKGMKNLWLTVDVRDGKAIFRVEDDGCGIPSERMAHLFTGLLDSCATADTSRSNMGIGLSVCSTIIKAHGSEMHVENRPQGGVAFWFALEMEDNRDVEQ